MSDGRRLFTPTGRRTGRPAPDAGARGDGVGADELEAFVSSGSAARPERPAGASPGALFAARAAVVAAPPQDRPSVDPGAAGERADAAPRTDEAPPVSERTPRERAPTPDFAEALKLATGGPATAPEASRAGSTPAPASSAEAADRARGEHAGRTPATVAAAPRDEEDPEFRRRLLAELEGGGGAAESASPDRGAAATPAEAPRAPEARRSSGEAAPEAGRAGAGAGATDEPRPARAGDDRARGTPAAPRISEMARPAGDAAPSSAAARRPAEAPAEPADAALTRAEWELDNAITEIVTNAHGKPRGEHAAAAEDYDFSHRRARAFFGERSAAIPAALPGGAVPERPEETETAPPGAEPDLATADPAGGGHGGTATHPAPEAPDASPEEVAHAAAARRAPEGPAAPEGFRTSRPKRRVPFFHFEGTEPDPDPARLQTPAHAPDPLAPRAPDAAARSADLDSVAARTVEEALFADDAEADAAAWEETDADADPRGSGRGGGRDSAPLEDDDAWLDDWLAAERAGRAEGRARPPRRSMAVIAAVLGVFVVGAVGFFAVGAFDGDVGTGDGPPPLIRADATDFKVPPPAADAPPEETDVYNRLARAAEAEERLVIPDRPELPAETGTADERALAADEMTARRVRTVVVRPDGTILRSPADGDGARPQAAGTTADAGAVAPSAPAQAPVERAEAVDPSGEAAAGPGTDDAAGTGDAAATDATATAAGAAPRVPRPRPPHEPSTERTARAPDGSARSGSGGPLVLAPGAAADDARSPERLARVDGGTRTDGGRATASDGDAGRRDSGVAARSPWVVQVASRRSESAARQSFAALQQRFPGILGGRQPLITQAVVGDRGTFWRVNVPAESRSAAAQLCTELKSAGGDCFIRRN